MKGLTVTSNWLSEVTCNAYGLVLEDHVALTTDNTIFEVVNIMHISPFRPNIAKKAFNFEIFISTLWKLPHSGQ